MNNKTGQEALRQNAQVLAGLLLAGEHTIVGIQREYGVSHPVVWRILERVTTEEQRGMIRRAGWRRGQWEKKPGQHRFREQRVARRIVRWECIGCAEEYAEKPEHCRKCTSGGFAPIRRAEEATDG